MAKKRFTAQALVCVICILFLVSCTEGKLRFLVCPDKYTELVDQQDNFALRREVLFKADEFSFLVVQKSVDGKVKDVQHYRAQHTFSNNVLPLEVSWEEPLHISTIVIIDDLTVEFGIAIKIDGESKWRIYWVPQNKLKKSQETGILYLPQYESLPFLDN